MPVALEQANGIIRSGEGLDIGKLKNHAHDIFWTRDKRRELRTILKELWLPAGLSHDVVSDRLKAIGSRAPAKQTLANFRNGDELERSSDILTGLSHVLYELAPSLSEGTVTEKSLAWLQDITAKAPAMEQTSGAPNSALRPYRWPKERLETLLRLIPIPDDDIDPKRPEFPPTNPRFPATPITSLTIRNRNIWIKDESWNWTGSHKDRWAWEQLLNYKEKLLAEIKIANIRNRNFIDVPQISMISNGSAAFALQALLRIWALPSLKVLVAEGRIRPRYIKALKAIGADVTESKEVDREELSGERICELTKNRRLDMDVTGGATSDIIIKYYDWLTCEILVNKPTYIFCPVGTGDLFFSIIKFIEREINGGKPRDCRIAGLSDDELKRIHVLGATTSNSSSQMDKLYASRRPSLKYIESSVQSIVEREIIGSESRIHYFESDDYVIEAHDSARAAGINTEHSGIAGLAFLLELIDNDKIPDNQTIVVINTGWLSPVLGTRD